MQIIDGFTLNNATPIDSRMVTSGTVSRNAIVYKYNGLRVYDIDSKQPYVWDGTAWVSENSSSVTISGSTLTGYIPKFNLSTSQITNSLIQEVDNGIKILSGSGTQPNVKLDVSGIVQATGFKGSGNALTNLNATQIVGQIPVSIIQNATGQNNEVYVIKAGTSTPVWQKLKDIPASSFPNPVIKVDRDTTTSLYLVFGASAGGEYKYYQTTGGDALKFIPKVNGTSEGAQLQIPNGSEGNPSIGFSTNPNTGIYRIGYNVFGISVNGKEKLRATEQGIAIKSNFITEATLKVQNPGGRPFIGLYGQNGDSALSGTIGFSGLWKGSAPLNDFIIESFAGNATKSSLQNNDHFDASITKSYPRHLINLNVYGQTIIATNAGSKWGGRTAPVGASSDNSPFTNGIYGCEISNQNANYGHGLLVRSGGGPSTVSARFDNGNKTIAYFTDRGLQIMSGNEKAPSICFDSDSAISRNTGFYLDSTKTIGIVAGNKKVLTISDTEIRISKVSNLAYIFGDDTRIEGTTRTNGLEIYRPTSNQGYAICHFYSDLGGKKSAKAYIYPDGSYYRLSDRRQKENIKDIEYGLSEVLKLRPVTHTWLNGSSKTSVGLIAQEVEEVISEVVNTTADGDTDIKALDYNGLIPVLIKSIQELNEKIRQLESK